MHFSQGKIKENSCLIHVMNILFSSNTLSRCFPGAIHMLHKQTYRDWVWRTMQKFCTLPSPWMSREHTRTHKPMWRATHCNENLSHTPHLYSSTEQLKFLNCHLLKFILDQKIFLLPSLCFTTAEFVFWRPLIASDKKVKPCKRWATGRADCQWR